MTDLDALFDDAPVVPRGRGGKREGAGRPRESDRAVANPETGETHFKKYDAARARHESAKADMAEIEAMKLAGSVVDRAAVREACAKAFAACSQSLDSIPDSLEADLGIDPAVAEKVREHIDAAKAALSLDLRRMFEEDGE